MTFCNEMKGTETNLCIEIVNSNKIVFKNMSEGKMLFSLYAHSQTPHTYIEIDSLVRCSFCFETNWDLYLNT